MKKSGRARKQKRKITQLDQPEPGPRSKYDPLFHPLDFIAFCKEGKHRSQVCMEWGIHRVTLDAWVEKYPVFKEHYMLGRECFEAFWYDLGLKMVLGDTKGNDKIYQFLAKNTIGWGDEAAHSPWNLAEQDTLEIIYE